MTDVTDKYITCEHKTVTATDVRQEVRPLARTGRVMETDVRDKRLDHL